MILPNTTRKKIILLTCVFSLFHRSCFSFEREVWGWGLNAIGACITAIGIYKILQKEKESQPITITNNNGPFIINFNPTSNTAKGTIVSVIGLFVAKQGINILQ